MSYRTHDVGVNALIAAQVGSTIQAYSSKLATLAGLTSVSNLTNLAGATLGNSKFLGTDSSGNIIGSDASTFRTSLGLGSAALASTGTSSGNIPVLDSSGKLANSVIPNLAITQVVTVADITARNALTTPGDIETGDAVVVTGTNQTFIYTGGGDSGSFTNAQFVEILASQVSNLGNVSGTLDVGHGGTGAATFTAKGVVYGDGTNALKVTAAATAQYQVMVADTNNVPSWGTVNLASTSAVSGTLPVGSGGTGATTLTSNGVLYGAGTSAVSATAAGTNGQVLYSNNGTPAFGAVALGNSSAVSGTLPVARGGTGASSANQNAVFAGPGTGGAGAPTFRDLVKADIKFSLDTSMISDLDYSLGQSVTTHSSGSLAVATSAHIILVTGTSGATINLPSANATEIQGKAKMYVIKDVGGSAGTSAISIVPDGSDKIDTLSSYSLNTNFESVTLVRGDATNWYII